MIRRPEVVVVNRQVEGGESSPFHASVRQAKFRISRIVKAWVK